MAMAGDQIWVAQGDYKPPVGGLFTIPSGVRVFGGFYALSGSEAINNATTRDLTAEGNNTVLSGLESPFFTETIVELLDVSEETVFESFEITGAIRTAVRLQDCHGQVRNILIHDNVALLPGNGAGMSIGGQALDLVVRDCIFRDNSSVDDAGAVACFDTTANFLNCIFEFNTAETGGAMRIDFNSDVDLESCIFKDNEATFGENGGGAILVDSSVISVRDTVFSDNTADGVGGAVAARFCPAVQFVRTSFTGNLGVGRGGGLYVNALTEGERSVRLANCEFLNNSLIHDPLNEFPGGGGAHIRKYETALLDNCLFVNNSAYKRRRLAP